MYMLSRQIARVQVQLHLFSHLVLDGYNWSPPHAGHLIPGKESQEPINEEEEEEATEPQSQSEHSKRRKKYFCPATNQTKIPQPSSPQPSHYTDYAILTTSVTYI